MGFVVLSIVEVSEQNSTVSSVCVDCCTAEWAIIAGKAIMFLKKIGTKEIIRDIL